MKSEWRKVNLGDVCDLIPGFAFKSKDFGSYPTKVVKIGDIQPPRVAIDCLEGVNLSSYSPNRLEKYLVTKGDFVLAMTGATIGKLGRILADKPAYINQRVLRFKPKENVDWNFIYYVVNTKDFSGFVYNHIDSETAQPNISAGTLATFSFSIPPLPIQRKIASILSSLDDKIETNNAICRNLEEQSEAIFSQYYQKENEPRLFTSVIQISGGGTPKTSEPSFWNGNIPFFTPKDAESPFAFTTEKTLTEEGLNNCSSILYPEWTTFITARGTVGKISLAGRAMAMNQSCYALISEEIHPLLIYFYALVVVKSLKQKASGAVFDAIVTRDFDREEIKLLKKDEQQLLLMRIEPIYTQIRSLKLENLKLAETRSALISKLMSGELSIDAIN
ncbi:MAG: restriction endonuclease subunit S [Akkermansia sp.]|nr:restriction endonuclease subunit S [Akkermansia sp.]